MNARAIEANAKRKKQCIVLDVVVDVYSVEIQEIGETNGLLN